MSGDVIASAPVVGSFTCPHQDGDFLVSVIDLSGWSTDSVLIRQKGQGDVYDISVNAEQARKLAEILNKFADTKLLQKAPRSLN